MDGIIGGLLGYLQDPRRTQQVQGIGNALEKGLLRLQESDRRFKELADRAFDPKNPGRIKDKEALKELTDMTMTGLLGFAPAGLTVFHGSPAKFKKFDPTKIGSGEGAQAYGYGHYVAESQDVAKQYRDKLTTGENYVNGELFDAYNPKHYLASALNDASGNVSEAKDFLKTMSVSGGSKSIKETAKSALELLNKGESPKLEFVKPEGSFYKIDLPDEQIAKMLDWDKPLSKQPQVVQDAMAKLGYKVNKADVDNYTDSLLSALMTDANVTLPKQPLDLTGEALYRKIGSPEIAAQKLRELGITGIRYLDQGSRGTGQGTSNFVVFPGNEDLLRILERNNTPLGLLD